MSRYAADTDVSAEKSRSEIERILARFGADQFMYGSKQEAAVIAFRAHGRHIRFLLPMPSDEDVSKTEAGYRRDSSKWAAAKEKEQRRRWRALALCIKAKLESIETGIESFDDAFMAQVILPNGETMSEHARPLIAAAYQTGKMPPLLPHLS